MGVGAASRQACACKQEREQVCEQHQAWEQVWEWQGLTGALRTRVRMPGSSNASRDGRVVMENRLLASLPPSVMFVRALLLGNVWPPLVPPPGLPLLC